VVSGISSASAAGASGNVAAGTGTGGAAAAGSAAGWLPGAGGVGSAGAAAGCGVAQPGGFLDVGADDPPAGTAAADGAQVDPALAGELAGERGGRHLPG
jgi:hypothetical protein